MAGLHDATATAADAPAAGSAGDKKIELTGAAEAIERLQKAAEKVAADAAALKAAPAQPAGDSVKAPSAQKSNPKPSLIRREAVAAGLGVVAVVCAALLGAYGGSERDQGPTIAEIEKFAPWKPLTAAQSSAESNLKKQAQNLAHEVQGLRAQLRKQTDEIQAAEARLSAQQAQMSGMQGQATAAQTAAAQLTSRVDRIEREAIQRMDRQTAQIERLERLYSDPVATSTIQKNHTNPPQEAKADGPKPVDRALAPGEFRLRGVRNGVATIQTNRGMIEVAEGDTVPGLGRVRGIEKVDGRWMVFLRNGVIDAD